MSHRYLSPRRSTEIDNERFPSFEHAKEDAEFAVASPKEISPGPSAAAPGQWPPRRTSQSLRTGRNGGPYKHRSKKSVTEAFDNFRQRRGSLSVNTQELAEALKAPVSYKLIVLCVIWYMTSALTNTSSKSILTAFRKPVTLTVIQFAFVSMWCLVFAYLASVFPAMKKAIPALQYGIRPPSKDIIMTTLPLAVFSLLGHLLSAEAMSKIPVSLVHTIKGLSPLFTVFAYRVVYRIRYARATYLSLLPLTAGVMLACSTDFSSNFLGILCALAAAVVFVTQNIFSKKLFTEASRADADGNAQKSRKLDKLNLLCYCSIGGFCLTAPFWLLSEGFIIIGDIWRDGAVQLSDRKGALDHGPLLAEYFFNGVFHFGQNIMAFILLSMLSPVSYSVASLIKRVWVIIVAILWFRNPTTPIQAFGVGLTFFGLYLYDRNSMDDIAERRARQDHFRARPALLPLAEESEKSNGHLLRPGAEPTRAFQFPEAQSKMEDETANAQHRSSVQGSWLPPGRKSESPP